MTSVVPVPVPTKKLKAMEQRIIELIRLQRLAEENVAQRRLDPTKAYVPPFPFSALFPSPTSPSLSVLKMSSNAWKKNTLLQFVK
jgi:hypothetical protein